MALASVIVLKPDILVIDEPTSQLDPEGTESVFKIIEEMKKEKKTVILVEHKIDWWRSTPTRCWVLRTAA